MAPCTQAELESLLLSSFIACTLIHHALVPLGLTSGIFYSPLDQYPGSHAVEPSVLPPTPSWSPITCIFNKPHAAGVQALRL